MDKRLLDEYEQLIMLQYILNQPSTYLHELQKNKSDRFSVTVSIATISRTIHHMGVSRQVLDHVALQRSDTVRAADISIYDPVMLIWLDESGQDKQNSVRRYGYSI